MCLENNFNQLCAMSFGAEFLNFVRTIGPSSRLRLAPTPSGFLHAGNALNFILNWLAARLQPGAKLLLRIDDLDADRKRPAYIADIFEALAWLGLDWDEGPTSPADFDADWSQIQRMPLYTKALAQVQAAGFVYACAKSRRDLAPFGGHYPLEFRDQHLPLDTPHVAWRAFTPSEFSLSDFIVRRRDGVPAYQLASLVDDLHFGVSHIIRGQDLWPSTVAQQWLAKQLGWVGFQEICFLHHPLIMDDQGEKLSKSAGATALRSLYTGLPHPSNQAGTAGPEMVFKQVAALLNLPTESIRTADNLLRLLGLALPTLRT